MYVCKIVLNYCLYFKINVEVNDGSSTDEKINPSTISRSQRVIT
jgi:hypothetical protein